MMKSSMNELRRRILVAAVLTLISVVSATAQNGGTVFVTATGAKYHTASCRSLAKSKIEISLADASPRYSPCKVCKPPVVASKSAVPVAPPPAHGDAPAAVARSGHCQATTKSGSQCSRRAKAGSSYCWQHVK